MLNIYAAAFMTATRTPAVRLKEMPPAIPRKRRWLPEGHWWLRPEREIDPRDL